MSNDIKRLHSWEESRGKNPVPQLDVNRYLIPDDHLKEGRITQDKASLLKPSKGMEKFFEGYTFRGLHKVHGVSRLTFLKNALSLLISIRDTVKQNGGTAEEAEDAYISTFRILAEKNLFLFCVLVLRLDFVNCDYGYRLCQDVQENKWNRIWVIAREHFKSTIITCASTLWESLKDPERTTCIYSYNVDTARTLFLAPIKEWCEQKSMIKLLWPDVMWQNPALGYEDREIEGEVRRYEYEWTRSALEFKRKSLRKEKTIEIGGIVGSSRTGAHFSHQIFDDAETQRNVETPEAIEKLTAQLEMAFNTGQTENMNVAMVGTFYAKDDAYCRFIKKGSSIIKEAVIQPCFDKDGKPIRFTMQKIWDKYCTLGPANFATQWLCDPSLSSSITFSEEWLHFWTPNPKGLNLYMVVDPAGNNPTRRSDYTAIAVFGKDSLGNLKFLYLGEDKLTFDKKFAKLAELVYAYRPLNIYYEKFGPQDDVAGFQVLMNERNIHFPITVFNTKTEGSKKERIERSLSYFSSGKIWLPEKCFDTNYLGERVDMIQQFIRDEYRGYPNVSHDDGIDVIASAVILDQKGYFEKPLRPYTFYDKLEDKRKKHYEPAEYTDIEAAYANYG